MDTPSRHVADPLPFGDTETHDAVDGPDADEGLEAVLRWFRQQPNVAGRFGEVLRQSIDEVLDGQRTGRFDIDTLASTEKTYLGTKVEIVARAEFDLGQGRRMDYLIGGYEVDAKFTSGTRSGTRGRRTFNWTIPLEAMGHICLLMRADDRNSTFRVGLIRITDRALNEGENRDRKKSLSQAGRAAIRWIVAEGQLPRNLLLSQSTETIRAIFGTLDDSRRSDRQSSGQSRTNELFRQVQEELVDRNTLVTVASQADGLKRARDARKFLAPQGILVLGHQNDHPRIARALNLPVPTKGSFVAVRLGLALPGDPRPHVVIDGTRYVAFREDEGDLPTTAPDSY